MKRALFTHFIILIFICMTVLSAAGEEVDKIIENMQAKYKTTEDFIIDFEKIVVWKLAGTADTVKGKIYWKKDDYYKFQTNSQLIVTDGKTVWSYSLYSNQTLIDYFQEEGELFLPREVLFDFPEKYISEYIGREIVGGRSCYVLQMVPRSDDYFLVQSLKVWIDPDTWLTRQVEHKDISDNLIIYNVRQFNINQELSTSFFRYSPVEGSDVIDMRE